MQPDDFTGWVPFGFRLDASGAAVEWCYLGTNRFKEPFFDQTIQRQLQDETRRERHRITSADTLAHLEASRPGLHPTGFIFHLSRCGSTLVSQMLAALPQIISVSEPCILETLLREGARRGPAAFEDHVRLFRKTVSALGQRRTGLEDFYFIKFASPAVLNLELIRSACPDVPWIFLYRDPLEVLVAIMGRQHDRLPPGVSGAGILDAAPDELSAMRPAEFWSRVLANRCSAALQACAEPNSRLVNYMELPDVLWDSLLGFFGVTSTADDRQLMQAASKLNAKVPSRPFAQDRSDKQRGATDEMRAAVDRFVMPYYERLESIRLARSATR